MGYLGARGTLIHEKSLKSKSRNYDHARKGTKVIIINQFIHKNTSISFYNHNPSFTISSDTIWNKKYK